MDSDQIPVGSPKLPAAGISSEIATKSSTTLLRLLVWQVEHPERLLGSPDVLPFKMAMSEPWHKLSKMLPKAHTGALSSDFLGLRVMLDRS